VKVRVREVFLKYCMGSRIVATATPFYSFQSPCAWDAKPVSPTPAHVAKQWTSENFTVYAAEGVALGTSATIG